MRLLLPFIFCIAPLFAHGLQTSTASIVQRHENHLSLSLNYNPLTVLHALEGHADLAALANMDDAGFQRKYLLLKTLFQSKLAIRVGGVPMESPHFRFSSDAAFKEVLRDAFMERMIPDTHHDHAHPPMLSVKLDGFIPKNATTPLQAVFPKEIGEVTVSFSKPLTKTLMPEINGTLASFPLQ